MKKIALLLTTICMLGMVILFTACPDLKQEINPAEMKPKGSLAEPKREIKLEPTPVSYTMIRTAEDLQKINDDPSGYFILANDIDMKDYLKANEWTPIGRTTPFSGTFDGKGYTIKNLKIGVSKNNTAGYHTGLFGKTKDAIITNLIIDYAGIWGFDYVGVLVGHAEKTTITAVGMKSSNKATVTGYRNVGGLVGYVVESTVSGYATGDVSGSLSVGGLVGYAQKNNTVIGYATGKVSGIGLVGGLVGSASSGPVIGYARGTVTRTKGTSTQYGLLVGKVEGGTVKGYHSATESKFSGIDSADATGTDGAAVTIASAKQATFGDFTFGTAVGTWKWMGNGKWPAINLPAFPGKGKFTADQQPIDP